MLIIFSGIFDGLDGPIARLLDAASRFGAELGTTVSSHFDSLCDYVNFGVAPMFVLYEWALKEYGTPGWAACLVYVIAMGCRLARFNAGTETSYLRCGFQCFKSNEDFFHGCACTCW